MTIKSLVRLVVKVLFLGTLFILVFSDTILASDVTARSCSAADIQAAIDNCISTGGGTVNLPACSADNTWVGSQGVTKTTNVTWRLKGAGVGSTVFGYADDETRTTYGIRFDGTGLVEVSGFTFRGAHGASGKIEGGICLYSYATVNLRVHHLKLERFAGTNGMLRVCHNPNSPILVDHCDFGDQSPNGGGAYGILVVGRNLASGYVIPASFGVNNPNAVFIEDCTFDKCYHSVSAFAVASIVFRYNTITNPTSYLDGHGPCFNVGCNAGQPDGHDNGTYIYEIYNNNITRSDWCVNPRGGTGMVTDNTFNNCTVAFRMEIEPCAKGVNCTAAAGCPHSSTDTTKCFQTPYQYWIWNNTYNSVAAQVGVGYGSECIRENYEYFKRAPTAGDPVTTYTKYQYPHPLGSGGSNPVSNPLPPPNPPPNAPIDLRIINP
jgi:hypothetical protein